MYCIYVLQQRLWVESYMNRLQRNNIQLFISGFIILFYAVDTHSPRESPSSPSKLSRIVLRVECFWVRGQAEYYVLPYRWRIKTLHLIGFPCLWIEASCKKKKFTALQWGFKNDRKWKWYTRWRGETYLKCLLFLYFSQVRFIPKGTLSLFWVYVDVYWIRNSWKMVWCIW